MIRDFMAYQPTMKELVDMELQRLPVNAAGYRLDVSAPGIRAGLGQYREEKGIPVMIPLSDAERLDFERWYIERKVMKERTQILREIKQKKTPEC